MDSPILEQTIRRVFPPGTTLVHTDEGAAPHERFWLVPAHGEPRWLVPDHPEFAWYALCRWRPYLLGSRLRWQIFRNFHRARQLRRLPGTRPIRVQTDAGSPWSHFGSDRPLVPCIYVGSPGPARKAVAFLHDLTAPRELSVGKVPIGPEAATGILREAEVLQLLSVHKPGVAPHLLFADTSSGLTVQTSVGIKLSPRRLTRAHLTLLGELFVGDASTNLASQALDLLQRAEQLAHLPERERPWLERSLSLIEDPIPLPAAWMHGDFAPWNLRYRADGGLVAVDWESARPAAVPLQDLFHFLYLPAYLFGTPAHRDLLGSLARSSLVKGFLESRRITNNQFSKLAIFYLASRWVESCQSQDHPLRYFLAAQLEHAARALA